MTLFLENPILFSAIILVAGIAAVVGLVSLWLWLRDNKQGYPNEEAIEEALAPLFHYAIMAAYKASEFVIDSTQRRLIGLDKRMLALTVYDAIPSVVMVGKVPVPVSVIKEMIPRDRFAELVQGAFDKFIAFYEDAEDRFRDQLEYLMRT